MGSRKNCAIAGASIEVLERLGLTGRKPKVGSNCTRFISPN